MNNKDLHNKLNQVIQEEIRSVLAEREYKFGGLLDPKNFDGYGTMTRSALRREIAKRLEGAARTAKTASAGGSGSYRMYKNLATDLEDKNVLFMFINAEIEVAEQLENIRTQGGRRATPIPKQF